MNRQPDPERYSTVSIILHWLMLLLVVAVYAAIELREIYPKGSVPREALKTWHFMLGLSVFALVWLRVAARLIWPGPGPAPGSGRLQLALSTAVHAALYILLVGMPLAGWLLLSAEGKPIPFFGFELPALAGENEGLADRIETIHELGGTIGYWLIGLHALAALFHHYVMRDRIIARMLPLGAR